MPSLEKATIVVTDTGEEIKVQFNPEEYTVSKDVNFAQTAVPGLSAPIIQFVHGNMQTLKMELLVDSYEEHREVNRIPNQAGEDVRNITQKITNLMDINPKTHAPPILLFTWGENFEFTCVLASASQRFILFRPDGTPVRARLDITFNQFNNAELEAKEIKRETANFSEIHRVGQGETLSNIAGQVYGNPALWRPIALHNDVDNPRELAVGTRLLVPQLPFRDPDTGEFYQ